MNDTSNFEMLHARMARQQRALIEQAAHADVLPAAGALRQIAGLEGALSAVDAALDEEAEQQVVPARKQENPARKLVPVDDEELAVATGTVKWFNTTKGYGFIAPDNGSPDVFVHISAVERAGMRELKDGQKLSFDVKADLNTGKSSAVDLKAVE